MERTTVVTGAASGIGKSLTTILRDRGERVIGVDLRDADVCADLSRTEGRQEAVSGVLDRSGCEVDAVVTCAGRSGVDPNLVSVNYFGAVRLLSALRPTLAAAPQPRVAVVGSMTAVHPTDPDLVSACDQDDEEQALTVAKEMVAAGRERQLYPSSKLALSRWVRGTSVVPEWASEGVALNAAAPGVVLTPMTEGLFEDTQMRQAMDAAVPMPLNGYAKPEVVARLLAWLVSAENSHVTGQVVFVDGGAEAKTRGAAVI